MKVLYGMTIACFMVRDSPVRTFSHDPLNVVRMAEIHWESFYRITEWKKLRAVCHYEPELEWLWHYKQVEILMKYMLTSQVGFPGRPVQVDMVFLTQAELNSASLNIRCKEL